METINVKEYGAWYVTGFAVIFVLSQKNLGKQEAQVEFDNQLVDAKGKANEAAALALEVAEQAKKSK